MVPSLKELMDLRERKSMSRITDMGDPDRFTSLKLRFSDV
jgi:hypothetical protein